MQILDQKLGTIGDIHISFAGGKLVVGVDADLPVEEQLAKLAAAHTSGVLGAILKVADAAMKALDPPAPVAP